MIRLDRTVNEKANLSKGKDAKLQGLLIEWQPVSKLCVLFV